MSRNARIEEVSDSDSDPSEMDPSDFDPSQIMSLMKPADVPSSSSSSTAQKPAAANTQQQQQQLQPQFQQRNSAQQAAEKERTKNFQCLYPVYFDITRSRAEGRRVKKAEGVSNPLARDVVDALQYIGYDARSELVFEPGKMHPKDWANPGRVRVSVKSSSNNVAKNKHHLYKRVAEYLRQHPTTEDSPMRLRIAGMPVPEKPVPAPAVPRGAKIGRILPLHSPALSGGGVNENFFKDMMEEMKGMPGQGGQGQGGMPGMGGLPPGLAGMLGGAGGGGGVGASHEKKKERKKGK